DGQPSSHWTFHTDDTGRTDSVSGDPHYADSNDSRRHQGGEFSAQGRAGREGDAAYDGTPYDHVQWDGGHLAANESGGPGEYVNMFPQMSASNSGNNRDGWVNAASWRAQEEYLRDFGGADNHAVQNYQVRMERGPDGVPTEVTMRWQEVTYQAGP